MANIEKISAPLPPEISLPLVSRRRERLRMMQKFQHAVPAVVLLGAGVHGLMQGVQGFAFALAIGELVVSVLLLRTLRKELAAARQPHPAHHHGVDWFDVFAAGVLTAEALEHWHTHHHLPRPTLLLVALTLALGLFHDQIAAFTARRRMLHIDASGIRVGGQVLFFRRFLAPWSEIERIDLDDRTARIVTRRRQRKIDLADLRNAPEVRQALVAAREWLAPAAAPKPG